MIYGRAKEERTVTEGRLSLNTPRDRGSQEVQEVSALKEGVVHSAECFTEAKRNKDMDLTNSRPLPNLARVVPVEGLG